MYTPIQNLFRLVTNLSHLISLGHTQLLLVEEAGMEAEAE
jgi:hypothetical protein